MTRLSTYMYATLYTFQFYAAATSAFGNVPLEIGSLDPEITSLERPFSARATGKHGKRERKTGKGRQVYVVASVGPQYIWL